MLSKRGYNFVQNITNVGFHGKPFIFFYFCDLDFIDYSFNFGGIHENVGRKNLNFGGIRGRQK